MYCIKGAPVDVAIAVRWLPARVEWAACPCTLVTLYQRLCIFHEISRTVITGSPLPFDLSIHSTFEAVNLVQMRQTFVNCPIRIAVRW